MIDNSYDEFSLTIDGSPIGDDAEDFCISLIRNSGFKVTDLLLSLKLHDQKLSGDQTAIWESMGMLIWAYGEFEQWIGM